MATSNLRRKANRAADETINTVEEGAEALRDAKNRADRRHGPRLDDAETSFDHLAENVGRHLRQTYETGWDTVQEGAETARKTVAGNPLLAVAGAFVGGLLAATLLRRR